MFGQTGKADKELFPSFYPDADEHRVSSTFWDDFSIADHFGDAAIRDTYRRAFAGWKSDYRYLTELTVVLNHKCWMWHERNETRSKLYADLYHKTNDYGKRTLKGDKARFFFKVLD